MSLARNAEEMLRPDEARGGVVADCRTLRVLALAQEVIGRQVGREVILRLLDDLAAAVVGIALLRARPGRYCSRHCCVRCAVVLLSGNAA